MQHPITALSTPLDPRAKPKIILYCQEVGLSESLTTTLADQLSIKQSSIDPTIVVFHYKSHEEIENFLQSTRKCLTPEQRHRVEALCPQATPEMA